MSNLGTRLSCAACGVAVVVTTAGDGEPACSGQPMIANAPPAAGPLPSGAGIVVQVGKRYRCSTCGQVLLCIRPGGGPLRCHQHDMLVVAPQQLPAGD